MIPGNSATLNAAARPVLEGERELKFTLSNGRVHVARQWLDDLCARDLEFPAAIVWTIYYDTPSLASLGEKINSDYLKQKIRLRWYSDLDGQVTGPAFVEAKLRVGNRRVKARAQLERLAEDVARWDLRDARLRTLPLLLQSQGILLNDAWQPVMLIRYRRDRFIERLSDSRVSLDSDIAGVAVNPSFVSAPDYTAIDTSVLEVKGAGDEMPLALRPLLHLGAQKSSFSKFLAVYAHMARHSF